MARILIIDDDPHIRDVIRFALEQANFDVDEAEDGAAGLRAFDATIHALVVLDVMMPELNGTEVCKRIRAKAATPIVFLSSRDEELDRVLGLELGADDYITKPFSPRELVARVRAMLRRMQLNTAQVAEATTLTVGRLTLDRDAFTVEFLDSSIDLTKTEFNLLWGLMRYPSKVFSREALMRHAYDDPAVIVSDRTIDSHIRHIRQKFEPLGVDPVETVHGLGYRLADV